jgi:hypothetical protein
MIVDVYLTHRRSQGKDGRPYQVGDTAPSNISVILKAKRDLMQSRVACECEKRLLYWLALLLKPMYDRSKGYCLNYAAALTSTNDSETWMQQRRKRLLAMNFRDTCAMIH